VFELGMMGPPLAGGVSAGILALLVWRTLRRHASSLGLGDGAGSFLEVDRTIWRRIIGIGLLPQLGRLAMWIAQLVYIQMLAHGAGSMVGGWGLALEALLILGLFSMSLAWGSAIMVGQNMGAGQWQRGIGVLIRAAGIVAMLLIVFLAWTPFARPLFGLLSDDPAVLDAAMGFLSVMRWGWIGMVIYQLLNAAYTAVGATKLAGTFVILSEVLGVAFALVWDGPVFEAVTYGFCLSCGVRAVLMLALIRRSLLAPLAEAAGKGKGAA
jgi:Na+-driven multidrug efflux pump